MHSRDVMAVSQEKNGSKTRPVGIQQKNQRKCSRLLSWSNGKRMIAFVAVLTIALSQAACSFSKSKLYQANGFAMDTVINQMVYSTQQQKAEDAEKKATAEINRLDKLMTNIGTGGDVNAINDSAGEKSVAVSSDTIKVLQRAEYMSKLSDGAFDITIGPLSKAWAISSDDPHVLSDSQIKKLLPLVDNSNVVLHAKKSLVSLKGKNQQIDLGGIAKGYAGDMVAQIYHKYGITSACANLGGNVVAVGNRPDGSQWSVGIQNPRGDNGEYIGYVKVSDCAVVTSGDYQRYFIKNGKRYCHILNAKTGKPANTGLMSVTIVCKSSIDADGLSTAVFALGMDQGKKLLKEYGKAEAIFITADKKIYITDGLKSTFTFDDESGAYTYVKEG